MSVVELATSSLFDDVALLCLDAGNTVIFLDHGRLAKLAQEAGFVVSAEALVVSEGRAKRRAEDGSLLDPSWSSSSLPGARSWGRMVSTILAEASVPEAALPGLLPVLWQAHVGRNLWCRVPNGLGAALDRYRAVGGKVVIVSNSEGMLDLLFAELGIGAHFDHVVDSGKVGVEKPDPRIFDFALRAANVPKEHALHLGDVFATDVLGARASGIRVGLVDPFGHYEGRHLDVPRVVGAPEVALALRLPPVRGTAIDPEAALTSNVE